MDGSDKRVYTLFLEFTERTRSIKSCREEVLAINKRSRNSKAKQLWDSLISNLELNRDWYLNNVRANELSVCIRFALQLGFSQREVDKLLGFSLLHGSKQLTIPPSRTRQELALVSALLEIPIEYMYPLETHITGHVRSTYEPWFEILPSKYIGTFPRRISHVFQAFSSTIGEIGNEVHVPLSLLSLPNYIQVSLLVDSPNPFRTLDWVPYLLYVAKAFFDITDSYVYTEALEHGTQRRIHRLSWAQQDKDIEYLARLYPRVFSSRTKTAAIMDVHGDTIYKANGPIFQDRDRRQFVTALKGL